MQFLIADWFISGRCFVAPMRNVQFEQMRSAWTTSMLRYFFSVYANSWQEKKTNYIFCFFLFGVAGRRFDFGSNWWQEAIHFIDTGQFETNGVWCRSTAEIFIFEISDWLSCVNHWVQFNSLSILIYFIRSFSRKEEDSSLPQLCAEHEHTFSAASFLREPGKLFFFKLLSTSSYYSSVLRYML